MSKSFIGIDYSLTSPATVIINPDGKIYSHAYAKKKQQGTYSYLNWTFKLDEYPVYRSDQSRYSILAENTISFVEKYANLTDPEFRIEGYSYGSKGQVFHLAENGGVLKHYLFIKQYPFTTIAPTSVKKYATGKGNADKLKMYESFVEKEKFDIKQVINDLSDAGKLNSPTSDIVDAYFIAMSLKDCIPGN